MSSKADNDAIKKAERKIGKEVATVVTSYVHGKLQNELNIKGKGSPYKKSKKEQLPLLEATKVVAVNGGNRLLGFSFKSNRAGFVNHFGTVRERTKHLVTLSNGTTFRRKTHGFDLKSHSFFDDIYEKSGAYKILEDGLSKTRTRAITLKLQNYILEINKENG
ncbi:hypothetical protein AUW17_03275 [Tenacibaculum dicentrarchi]|uniref:hypothetical protein n=1 Tax=Tenacibaculum finnmarkense TaxID=2781243 RepID=UPI000739001F|nr:hypothetical protein AUW17_03275 [Tenacibaculum dicentrarchi]